MLGGVPKRLLILAACGLLGGCVERTMTITSEPSGALVHLNNREIGRTPVETDFTWYGTYDVQVRADGYQTLDVAQSVPAPWWQIPPIDLFAEMMPWKPKDHRPLHYTLEPVTPEQTDATAMLERAAELRGQLGVPTTAPSP
jgi:hypothetical protein